MRRILFLLAFLLLAPAAHAAFPADALPSDRGSGRGGASAPGDFMLWWDMPVRWYTGLAMSHRVSYYEVDNRKLTWSISNAPSGMTIDGTGTISWASPTAGTHSNIVVTVTRPTCNSTDFPSCSTTASQTFTLVVGTTDHKFVDDTGTNNGSCGTLASPCATLSYTITNRLPGGTDGVTIWVRSGSYTDSWAQGSAGEFANNYGTSDYMWVRNYPGESPAIDASAASGLPTSDSSAFVVIEGLRIHGATAADRGNFVLRGTHIILKDSISDSASFSGADNCTGIVAIGNDDIVINRVVSHSNENATGTQTNISNILVYVGEDTNVGDTFVMNSKTYNSNSGIKIKHCEDATSRLIVHNWEQTAPNVDYDSWIGNCGKSSIRHSVIYDDDGYGMWFAITDPNAPFTEGGMFLDHNTIVSSRANSYAAVRVENDGPYASVGTMTMRRNIVYQSGGACTGQNPDTASSNHLLAMWYYGTQSTVDDYPFEADRNIYWNTGGASASCFHLGNTGSPAAVDFAGWQALDSGASIIRDPNSLFEDPELDNVATGDLDCGLTDNCATDCGSGEYCGALRPGQTYGTFGASNTTLISFDHSGNSTGAPPPSSGSSSDSTFAALYKYLCGRKDK